MIKLLLINPSKANLPEINVYKNYFNSNLDFETYVCNSCEKINFSNFDIIWKFMGFDFFQRFELNFFKNFSIFECNFKKKQSNEINPKNKNNIRPFVIHEYPSLSTGKFKKLKNLLKKNFNSKPNLRIFLNKKVKKEFGFDDEVPFFYRDMGIPKNFFLSKENKKIYDFVYVGEINFDRKIDVLLNIFTKNEFLNKTIILIGKPSKKIYNKFSKYKNIIFKGYISHENIPNIAKYANFAINWVPNIYPYNLQTSTKLLEYSAMNLKIINLHNDWANNFEKNNNLKFFNINKIEDFKMNDIEKYEFISYNTFLENYEWNNYLNNIKLKNNILTFYKRYKNNNL